MKKIFVIALTAFLSGCAALAANENNYCPCDPPEDPDPGLECLNSDGPTGQLGMLRIPTDGPGRLTIGDLDGDSVPDYVVSRRHWVSAYNVCGEKLWGTKTRANWDNTREDGTPGHDIGHPYWNWTSYGWIGDANGDGTNEFLNISDDWRTLIIRDADSGNLEVTFDLGPGKWQYVMIGQAADGSPRVIVTHKPGRLKVKSLDLRGGLSVDWSIDRNYRLTHYIPPQLGDINADGHDDILHGSTAIDGRNGALLWRHGLGRYGIGGAHTGSLRQLDGNPGLEAVFTVYSPKSDSSPSLVVVGPDGQLKQVLNGGRHAHQHTVGDFNTDVPGLETIGRDFDGRSHWMIDHRGRVISRGFRLNPRTLHGRWGMDWGDDAGELIQSIDWDGQGADELLYIERHVSLKNIPMLAVHSLDKRKFLYRALHGGIDVARTDPNSLGWYGRLDSNYIGDDGPYEGGAHVADVVGDGREEIIAMAHNQIVVYYNSGNAGVPKKWGGHQYMARKKMWTQVYNPR